jgi:hypothetical protein
MPRPNADPLLFEMSHRASFVVMIVPARLNAPPTKRLLPLNDNANA